MEQFNWNNSFQFVFVLWGKCVNIYDRTLWIKPRFTPIEHSQWILDDKKNYKFNRNFFYVVSADLNWIDFCKFMNTKMTFKVFLKVLESSFQRIFPKITLISFERKNVKAIGLKSTLGVVHKWHHAILEIFWSPSPHHKAFYY